MAPTLPRTLTIARVRHPTTRSSKRPSRSSLRCSSLLLLAAFALSLCPPFVSAATFQGDTDALHEFKAAVANPSALSWPDSGGDPCIDGWSHVTCTRDAITQEHRISSLLIDGLNLGGSGSPFPTQLARLEYLHALFIGNNGFAGEIPRELGELARMEQLGLDHNGFTSAPQDLFTNMTALEALYLQSNPLGGQPPPDLSANTNLKILLLTNCSFTGELPSYLASLVALTNVSLGLNAFDGGIPEGMFGAHMPSLLSLRLNNNRLTGPIPASLASAPLLSELWLHGNDLSGPIPDALGGPLSLLQSVKVYENGLVGMLPESLGEARQLSELQVQRNKLVGPIPAFMKRFGEGSWGENGWCAPSPGDACSDEAMALLEFLRGVEYAPALSDSWVANDPCASGSAGNSSGGQSSSATWLGVGCSADGQVTSLTIPSQNLNGTISASLARLPALEMLQLPDNNLEGSLPAELAKLPVLRAVNVANNQLTGPLPDFPPQVTVVTTGNKLEGGAPASALPPPVAPPASIRGNPGGNARGTPSPGDSNHSAASNGGRGGSGGSGAGTKSRPASSPHTVPASSSLSSPLSAPPSSPGAPSPTSATPSLPSPTSATPSLPSPTSDTSRTASSSPGASLSSPPTSPPPPDASASGLSTPLIAVISVAALLLLLVVLCAGVLGMRYWRKKGGSGGRKGAAAAASQILPSVAPSPHSSAAFSASSGPYSSATEGAAGGVHSAASAGAGDAASGGEGGGGNGGMVMRMDVIRAATGGFAAENIIGKGGFGTVYKGELADGTGVAVKRMEVAQLAKKGDSEFQAEIEVLSSVRHRHLLGLLGYAVEGNERVLVYQLMARGPLSRHLFDHRRLALPPLTWRARVSVALDVARGVEYLHSLAHTSFIHRDLKASNILLDEGMRARVADFGLVKHSKGDGMQSIETRIAGTFGYLAPEYAVTGRVTTRSDVYSYGVVLMELITGRRALDDSKADEAAHLATWLAPLVPLRDQLAKVVDPVLLPEMPEEHGSEHGYGGVFPSVCAVADLAVELGFGSGLEAEGARKGGGMQTLQVADIGAGRQRGREGRAAGSKLMSEVVVGGGARRGGGGEQGGGNMKGGVGGGMSLEEQYVRQGSWEGGSSDGSARSIPTFIQPRLALSGR
ncbi:unnamed protein product [Closterium sp. Yama58-4]|nr:unnamed protein product [Closterium sp. Yama58-4]